MTSAGCRPGTAGLVQTQRRGWPDLSVVDLGPTVSTLHLWMQIVGKVRLRLTPWENHGWHVPLYVSARGLSTGLVPVPGKAFSMEFDLISSCLRLAVSDGGEGEIVLASGSMATFYAGVIDTLRDLGIDVRIDAMPNEIPEATPFDADHAHRSYDPNVAWKYWQALLEIQRVFQLFRTRYVGKCSPIHLFWGAFDLALTRFSGRRAPLHPGGAVNMPDAVAREAYSHEVSSAGFWPNIGGPDGPCFYSYAYPAPDGFAGRAAGPLEARYDDRLGEYLLPYSAVRRSADPDGELLDFLQATYEAAADLGGWDRAELERSSGPLGRPPEKTGN